MDKPLFSIILLYYNQASYVKAALKSIFIQNYENIELVFADDASYEIDLDDITQYIELNKKGNIKKVEWQLNSKNLGTVKTLNAAVKKCTGKYLLFFAADDQLYDKNVIDNFYSNFEKADQDIYMISSQCHMMDVDMKNKLHNFVKPSFANAFNKFSAKEQFSVFVKSCFLAIGATAMKMDMFEKYGYFNEKYKYVEDWTYFLHLTRLGGRIQYCNFDGLLHRDGGVSHYIDPVLMPPHVLLYKLDIVKIFEKEILPYISYFNAKDKKAAVDWYESLRSDYINAGGNYNTISKWAVLKHLPLFCIRRTLFNFNRRLVEHIRKAFEWLMKFNILWLTFFVMNQFLKFLFIEVCLYAVSFIILVFGIGILLMFLLKALYIARYFIRKILRGV